MKKIKEWATSLQQVLDIAITSRYQKKRIGGVKWIQGRHVLLIFATHFCLLAAAFTDSSLAIADGVIWYTYKAATTKSLVDVMKDFKKELVVVEWCEA